MAVETARLDSIGRSGHGKKSLILLRIVSYIALRSFKKENVFEIKAIVL
jgi:hypothetical protein